MSNLPEEIFLLQDAAYSLIARNGDMKLYDNVIVVGTGRPAILQSINTLYWPASIERENFWGFYKFTLVGVVIESLSKAWATPIDKILEVSTFDENHKEIIGILNKKPVRKTVRVIKKPKNP